MMAVARSEFLPVASSLWAALDDAICLRDTEIYSYNPGEYTDFFMVKFFICVRNINPFTFF